MCASTTTPPPGRRPERFDQRLNYAAAAWHAHGSALDTFAPTRGPCAASCKIVLACDRVDASRAALEVAGSQSGAESRGWPWTGLRRMPFCCCAIATLRGSAFRHHRADPPALRSLRALRRGGSAGVQGAEPCGRCGCLAGWASDYVFMLALCLAGGLYQVGCGGGRGCAPNGASDAGMRGAAPDHPSILTLPETNYLKCLVLHVG